MTKNLLAKLFCTALLLLNTCIFVNAQVTTNSGSGLAATYTSLDAAITALNAATISSPVVITLTAANPQMAPAGGYELRAEGTSVNTIRIVGNNNTITASAALTPGNLNDGIFKIIGGDNISIENFMMLENAANLTTDAATNNMTEWGVALLYISTTNGAQNNTIRGCTIDLNRTYQNTFGIYSNSNHTATAVSAAVPPPSATGGNNGLTITACTITDINVGIVVIGPSTASAENDGLTIGGSLANANSITNFGTTGTFSSYANVSGTVNGILVRFVKNLSISFNTITSSNGGTIAGSLRGIYIPSATTAPTGSIINTISNNTISLRSAVAAGAIQGISVEAITVNATTTLNINNNDFNTFGHTIVASGAINGIINTAPALVISISNNTFTNLNVNTTGSFTFLSSSVTLPAGGSHTVSGNSIVTAFNKTGDGGTVTLFTTTSNSPTGTTSTSSNNNFSNITVVGATSIAGWINRDGANNLSGPVKTVNNNTFNNWTGGTLTITALTVNAGAAGSTTSGNTITNINGAGSVTGLSILGSENGNISNNNINGLTTTGAVAVNAITASGTTGGTSTLSFFKNKIYNITANNSGGSVNGLIVSFGGTYIGSIAIFNNLIGDLKAPLSNNDASDVIRGINITATAATSTINVYYNTVYLNATSSGANFGTTAIFHTQSATATTATLDLRNNILINTSSASGFGNTAVFRRSASGLDNYASSSNNNIFFAGTPSASNVIYLDGATAYSTLASFKTLVSTRETASGTENVSFISLAGSNINFLHVNTTTPTYAEGRAQVIATITDDFDGNARGTTPDIGADEFAGIILPVTLVNFSGTKQAFGNELSWTSATEINNQGFEVLRSSDGISFSKLIFISSKANAGNSSSNLTYSFVDKFPTTTNNYYRLKQIDKDGKTSFSNIVLLKGNSVNKLQLTSIYPNPATDRLTLLIASPKSENVSIFITDFMGKMVIKQQAQIVNGQTNIQVAINSLSKGNYTINITSNDGFETVSSKFIKM